MKTEFVFTENRNLTKFTDDVNTYMSEKLENVESAVVNNGIPGESPLKFKITGKTNMSGSPSVNSPALFSSTTNPEVTIVGKNLLNPKTYSCSADAVTKQLKSTDFVNGFWDGRDTEGSFTTLRSINLYTVQAGDSIFYKTLADSAKPELMIGVWMFPLSGDLGTKAARLIDYTTSSADGDTYTFEEGGEVYIQFRKSDNSQIDVSDYNARIRFTLAAVDLSIGNKLIIEEEGINRFLAMSNGVYEVTTESSTTIVDPTNFRHFWLLCRIPMLTSDYTISGKIEQVGVTSFQNNVTVSVYPLDSEYVIKDVINATPMVNGTTPVHFNVSGCSYIAIRVGANALTEVGIKKYILTNVQLEAGNSQTSYVDYRSVTYKYEGILRSFTPVDDDGNDEETIFDEWDILTQTVNRKVGESIFKGSEEENWSMVNIEYSGMSTNDPGRTFKIAVDNMEKNSKASGKCNRFTPRKSPKIGLAGSSEGYITFGCILQDDNDNPDRSIFIRYNNASLTSVATWKTWLDTHHVETYYKLEAPTTEQLDLLVPVIEEGKFFIFCSNGCKVNLTYKRKPFN